MKKHHKKSMKKHHKKMKDDDLVGVAKYAIKAGVVLGVANTVLGATKKY